jgi:hypothetical protein
MGDLDSRAKITKWINKWKGLQKDPGLIGENNGRSKN